MTVASSSHTVRRRSRLRQVLARQCFRCHTPLSRRVVAHPSGPVIVCQQCGHVERTSDRVLRAVGR
ncbi:hypothetical protein FB474_0684 [Oryzihumus leptocrescens]|uniref:Uncharacterized protein n=1 Tax=Oryzihumus leptocrescens TaxID=297536 RepID=A0A542ZGK1_9MICO|nr:hypothetical protein FB474_0684 [Oryzihumus leptocrescens]